MYETCRKTELPEEKKSIEDSYEIPDGENTVSCTNLKEPLNLLRRNVLLE